MILQCSIDALLERTIKHMLFLQSVTKHADKLKKTGESKVRKYSLLCLVSFETYKGNNCVISFFFFLMQIISKEGGLVFKDNFEGGATWAYEVGSQSMVCPIIVEDLNTPRQMLVEVKMILYRYIKLFGPNISIASIIRLVGYSSRCFARNVVSFWKLPT